MDQYINHTPLQIAVETFFLAQARSHHLHHSEIH